MSHYKHLTLIEREKIMFFSAMGYSIGNISKELNRSKSTISRELKRNSKSGVYIPCKAQDTYKKRRKACRPKRKLDDPMIWEFVRAKFLEHKWSPEQISGRIKHEDSSIRISYSTIYRGIYAGLFDTLEQRKSKRNRGAIRKLRHRGKTRHTKGHTEKRGKIRISNNLSERPTIADTRSRIGDWEADTVIGKAGMACMVTFVDRKSRFLLVGKAAKKSSIYVTPTIIDMLKNQPLNTITPDRGKEFSNHEEISKALENVQFYFTLPYHPWQRGTNENTNGLLREYFPKGQDLTAIPEEYIQSIALELNCRPRKCLGYLTPYEIYNSTVLHLT